MLAITDGERVELERRVRAQTSSQRVAKRARVILLAAQGLPIRRIAGVVGMDQHNVGRWRRQFEARRLEGLEDQARPGRPRKFGHDEGLAIVAKATSARPEHASHWSHRRLAAGLDFAISESQVGRILADLDVKPHLVRSWLTRPAGPEFWERAANGCGL